DGFAAGDRVIGYARWGAARAKVVVGTEKLIKIPAGLEADRAAGLIVTYGTSYYALKDRAGLKRGETLAVLGASGGVGLAAADLVRWCAEGKLSAHVHAAYPLAKAAQALKDIAERKVMGKVVLKP